MNDNITKLLEEVKDIVQQKQKEDSKLKFNIFSAISDVFYKENFHSDILFMFLQQEPIYKNLFEALDIEYTQDGSVKVFKEYPTFTEEKYGRIDIFIQYKDQECKLHCIIIENKINNAVDQERQLWRYYDHCVQKGIQVDKIVYLTLKENEPDMGDCTDLEEREIRKILETKTATDFVEIISKDAENLDVNTWSALIQYKNLIAYLNGDTTMNANCKIYEIIKNGQGNYEILKEFYNVFDKFPEFIAKDVFKKLTESKGDLFSSEFTNIKINKQYIYLDTKQIKNDERTDADYGFRLELFFAHDYFFVQFRYYGYRNADDEKLINLMKDKNTPLNFGDEYTNPNIEYPNCISIKISHNFNNPNKIEKIVLDDMKKFYEQVNNFVGNYIKNLNPPSES